MVTGSQTPWNMAQDAPYIVGGIGGLQVQASLPGVTGNPVTTSFPRWINIPGTNPQNPAVNSEIAADDPVAADDNIIEHIFCYESGGQGLAYLQFNPVKNKTEEEFPDIPSGFPNPPVLQPNYGEPPAGIGLAQLDPAAFPARQWDWTQNVLGGVQEYQMDLAAATAWPGIEQARLTDEYLTAVNLVKATAAAKHLPPPVIPGLVLIPPEPAPYSGIDGVTADAITRYNTGAFTPSGVPRSLFYFNYQYYVSADNLQVLTKGSPTWVEQDGSWGTNHGIHKPLTWIANGSWDPNYPNLVMACTPPQ